jgi:hypothetical protein
LVKEVNPKDDIFGFKGGYPARFVKSPPSHGYLLHVGTPTLLLLLHLDNKPILGISWSVWKWSR